MHEDEKGQTSRDIGPPVSRGQKIGGDRCGQIPYLALPMLIGLMVLLIGLSIVGSDLGVGLIWIGAGLALGGFGGYMTMNHPILAISGTGGIVLIVLGALIDKLSGL